MTTTADQIRAIVREELQRALRSTVQYAQPRSVRGAEMTIITALAGPIFILALAVLAMSMLMSPLDPPYGVVEALKAGLR